MTSKANPTYGPTPGVITVPPEEFILHQHLYKIGVVAEFHSAISSGMSTFPQQGNSSLHAAWSEPPLIQARIYDLIAGQMHTPNITGQDPIPYPAGSATSDAINAELLLEAKLVTQFETYVREAKSERFVDGMASTFATRVHQSLINNGHVAVAAWHRILMRTGNLYETGEELLRQLGLLRHESTHQLRLRALTDNLSSTDLRIRDAAILGLSFLEDPSALQALRQARSLETDPWLQEDLDSVIKQLEALQCRDI